MRVIGKTISVWVLGTLLLFTPTQRSEATLLYDSVISDGNGFYTYIYTVNNLSGDRAVTQLNILVVNGTQAGLNPGVQSSTPPQPLFYTSPLVLEPAYRNGSFTGLVPGLSAFNISFGGGGSPPMYENGSFYAWQTYVPVGAIVSGFSFTVPYAPTTSPLNDFFLYGWNISSTGTAIDGGIIDFGNITAPFIPNTAVNPPPAVTPLPAALPLFATGLCALGLFGWRRKRQRLMTELEHA